ncbi:DUF1223 domain-containing protein [Nitratireductor sp. CAU 1489]|uniref:DUF1223 domain-containing protein n=1 Tax=Nitratireductor arenosus TaxID=2682096 RepID=A0A844QCW1_9HYPH|nr:DUF1223 domain-containing protein [Nitratireductor arenosus]MVA96464.1 DUF1223 domain-containing protein [Nitratireductor arenosus]
MDLFRGLRLAFAAAAFFGLASAAKGEEQARPRGVVELFTSQGCNSCPKADAYLGELARSGDVVALAYHVDYWDYLGWRDTMATADNTGRQSEYARALGERSVYTPQAVVNGRVHMNGASRGKVEKALGSLKDAGKGLTVDLSLSEGVESVIIEAGAAPGTARKANLLLVFFDPVTPVEIKRGENAGKTVTYWNAVSGIQSVGMWSGQEIRVEIPASELKKRGAAGCAVLLQSLDEDGNPGAIIGAAILDTPQG